MQHTTMRRLAIAAGLACFLGAAALIRPDWARGDAGPTAGDPATPTVRAVPTARPESWTPLGTLEGPEGTIELMATPDGPRYRRIGPDGTPDPSGWQSIESLDVVLPPVDGDADAPVQMMLADPPPHFPN